MSTDQREQLSSALRSDAPGAELAELFERGAREWLPEVWALAELSEDPAGDLHKDNYTHTLRVVDQCGPEADLVTRLAALFHDVGKAPTRRVVGTTVSFHGHEMVGVRLATRRLVALGFERSMTSEVCDTMLASSRIQSYEQSWTDSAVRRVRREAGAGWERAVVLARADCTTRFEHKRRRLHASIDALVAREASLASADAAAAERPVLSGHDLMAIGIPAGPALGQLLAWLLEENRAGRLLDAEEAAQAVLDRVS